MTARSSGRPPAVETADVVDRLVRLRALLPAMAQELASARRNATALRIENERLVRRVAELESHLEQLRRD